MANSATATDVQRPSTIVALRQLIEELRAEAEAEDTVTGQIVGLTEIKREVERALRTVKESLAPRHEQMLDTFAQRGETSARHAASGQLVYVSRQLWARAAGGDKPAACSALKEAGLGDFVEEGFNVHSLSAYFRELRERDGAIDVDSLLPAQLRGAIELTEDHKIGVRG